MNLEKPSWIYTGRMMFCIFAKDNL